MSYGEIWWFIGFCGDHCFDFYILTILGIFILRKKCQMPKDHIEFFYLHST
jgi:hypothetical protein